MNLIYLIFCDKCNKETGIATTNKNNLDNMPYQCDQCGHKGVGTKNYQTIEKEKYLEGYEKIDGPEPEEEE